MLCPMNHSKEKWRFAMVICGRMELVQILLAMLNCLAEKGNCADFAPFPVQIRNWVFCIKPQITNFHIEELTAPAAVSYMRIINTRFRKSLGLDGSGC